MKKIIIKPYERRTEVRFSKTISQDIETILINCLRNLGLKCKIEQIHIESNESWLFKIDSRLKSDKRRKLLRELYSNCGVAFESPDKIIRKKMIKKHVIETDKINGFSGCLITGHELKFNYC